MWQTVLRPATVPAALTELARSERVARIVAGGTDVLVELQRGIKPAQTLIDISGLRDLKYVRHEGPFVALGGLATHNDVLAAPFARSAALPLAQACIEVGAPQIRSRATIAGNVATGSPANDTIAPLLALDATLILASVSGERAVPIADFYPGFRTTVLRPDELIREIRFSALTTRRRGIFLKLGLRGAQAISVIDVAFVLTFADDGTVADARIALGCLAPTVVRAYSAESVLIGHALDGRRCVLAAEAAATDAAPISDVRGSAGYRSTTLRALVRSGLERLADGREADGYPAQPVLLQTRPQSDPARSRALPFDGDVTATINGERRKLPGVGRKTLLNALRDDAGLTGAKEGCGEGECGACTVWLDGAAVMSCLVPAAQADGATITTIEGLADGDTLHPLQQAYIDCGAVQCGFCIPGMIMAGAKLLEERHAPDLAEQQAAISGNLCRCTGYRKILDAMTATAHVLAEYEPLPAAVRV